MRKDAKRLSRLVAVPLLVRTRPFSIGYGPASLEALLHHEERPAESVVRQCRDDGKAVALVEWSRLIVTGLEPELVAAKTLTSRFELEQQILAGQLAVKDLPEAWNAGMDAKLGVRPANDAEGCLQDIHWAVGSFGYFPSYALGAMIAGQLYEALLTDQPGIEDEFASGKFTSLFEWLRKNVHGHGAKYSVQDLIKNATGKPLSAAAFLRYAEAKYLEPSR